MDIGTVRINCINSGFEAGFTAVTIGGAEKVLWLQNAFQGAVTRMLFPTRQMESSIQDEFLADLKCKLHYALHPDGTRFMVIYLSHLETTL